MTRQKKLDQLTEALRKMPMTARQISVAFGCSRPTAYEWLEALRESGVDLFETRARKSKTTGPVARVFRVA